MEQIRAVVVDPGAPGRLVIRPVPEPSPVPEKQKREQGKLRLRRRGSYGR